MRIDQRIFTAFFLFAAAQHASAEFIPLGDLPGGAFFSRAQGVSADGSVVVGASASDSGLFDAFRWTRPAGMVRLGSLPTSAFYFSTAIAASGDGSVVVGASDISQGNLAAFRWTQVTGLSLLGFLPGGTDSVARAVSLDGSVIVGFSNSQAFRWTEPEGLVGLGGISSAAFGVSGDGSVVVGYSVAANGTEAFRWTQQTGLVGLGDLGGAAFHSEARAVSLDGSVIVGASDSAGPRQEAFRWTQTSGMVGLGDLIGSSASIALAVSADGSVIVGDSYANFDPCQHIAFIWDSSSGIRSLRDVLIGQGDDLTGWILNQAMGISADGETIVGAGFNPAGQPEGWLARLGAQPIPEPSSVVLLGFGILVLLRFQGRNENRVSSGTDNLRRSVTQSPRALAQPERGIYCFDAQRKQTCSDLRSGANCLCIGGYC